MIIIDYHLRHLFSKEYYILTFAEANGLLLGINFYRAEGSENFCEKWKIAQSVLKRNYSNLNGSIYNIELLPRIRITQKTHFEKVNHAKILAFPLSF